MLWTEDGLEVKPMLAYINGREGVRLMLAQASHMGSVECYLKGVRDTTQATRGAISSSLLGNSGDSSAYTLVLQ